jgi:O-acetyl-ADP-ribose deacetylase (regulator of RNase III)
MTAARSTIEVRVGDMFESGAQTLVNTVNTEGVMGKGIALKFRRRFPAMHDDYVERCRRGEVRLGEPYLYQGLSDQWILNFPTKSTWRSHSRLADIQAGLDYLKDRYSAWGIQSLAVPPLGAGLGGLEWRVVGRVLYRAFRQFEIPVFLYAPHGTPEEQLEPEFLAQTAETPFDVGPVRVPPGWAAVAEIVARIERQPYRWPLGRTMFQKIAYFATEAGIPTEFRFEKRGYGPFSPDVEPMKTRMLANGLLAERPLGKKMLLVLTGPALREAREAYVASLTEWSEIIDRVADLFVRLDTRQAEIAATVHFAARYLAPERADEPTELDVLEAVKEWKLRRDPPLPENEVAETIRNLNLHGWIHVEQSPELPVAPDLLVDTADLDLATGHGRRP